MEVSDGRAITMDRILDGSARCIWGKMMNLAPVSSSEITRLIRILRLG